MIKRLAYKPLDIEKELITCARDGDKEGLLSTFRLMQRINKSNAFKDV